MDETRKKETKGSESNEIQRKKKKYEKRGRSEI
uniref:Uncharacterized protein n=1 Tax=Nelumbo nucifera TaxID=4432 RepID=A0A822Z2H8_NELNU|nr:TPA_asm: hypothetical protein HUJ06_013035 [Nelumbo nucifera]